MIDEIDILMTKSQTVYYNLFDWAFNFRKIIFITIGNTLDFSKQLSNKVASRMGSSTIIFKPYNHKQILRIVKQIVAKPDLYEENAMVYASKKMATVTSDLRKIISVLERAEKEKG